MQLLATGAQMQEFDRSAMGTYAVPGLLLMENAGRAFADGLERAYGSVKGRKVVVVCGKGNNGGDGFVIARHLANRGGDVTVALLAGRGTLVGDSKVMFAAIARMAAARKGNLAVVDARTATGLKRLSRPEIVVDAIFGTGFTGAAKEMYEPAIGWINQQQAFVAAVDIPSGVDATTGTVGNVAVRAAITITMALAKTGQFVGAGREHAGSVEVADIGMPSFILRPGRSQTYRVQSGDVRAALPGRSLTAHKYSVGKVFVLGGSAGFTGAPAMTALSALRVGAGAVILGIPRSIHAILAKKLTEVILLSLDETEAGTVSPAAVHAIEAKIDWADVVAIGPGLSRNPETDSLLLTIMAQCDKPLVVDADALTALAGNTGIVRARRAETILTPHVGELARLTGGKAPQIEALRVSAARDAAKHLRSIVVLKGAPTVTAVPAGETYLNSTGNPGMATIGSGDVLTGTIAGLWAQRMPALPAAYAGVFVHGLAGDLAAARLGQRGLLATDILENLSGALQSIAEG